MYNTLEQEVIDYLKLFKTDGGLYIISVKKNKLGELKKICSKLEFEHKSNVAYVGKAAKLKTTNLYVRSRQEMGWSNFSGATFVKKIGKYLGVNVKLNRVKDQQRTREFILDTFLIKCKVLPKGINLLEWETQHISRLKPCLNQKKNNK